MKKFYIGMYLGILGLFALALWKNSHSYSLKPRKWRIVKSIIDTATVICAAVYLPALLVGWTVMWLTRPIRRRGIQLTLALILGIAFSSVGGVLLELLCVLGIFSVDLLTGRQGIYGWWTSGPPVNFMPSLVKNKHASA